MARKIRITTPSGKQGILTVPDDATPEQIRQAAEQIEGSESILSKVNKSAFNTVQTGLEAASAPLEMVGEAIRVPVEGKDGFRAPSIVQRAFPSTRTEEPPSIGVDVVNKLLRAGAAFASSLPQGVEKAQNAALSAYQSDRGTLGTVEDTALGLLAGKIPLGTTTVANAPLEAAGKAVKGAGKLASGAGKSLTKGAVRLGSGLTGEQQSTIFRRPEDLKNAPKNFDELSEKFANTANNLAEKVNEIDDLAWDSLLKLRSEPKSKIIKTLQNVRREFVGTGGTRIGAEDRKAVALIDDYIERVKGIKQTGAKPTPGTEEFLDQRQLREIVQSVRRDATFGLGESDAQNRAAQAISGKLDAVLKENGNYAEVMDRLAPATKALKGAIKEFGLKREPGVGYVPSNKTASKLASLGKDKTPETKKVIENVSKQTGVDFADQAKLTETVKAIAPAERARGSARTVLGSIIGAALDPFVPGGPAVSAAGGAALGRGADVYGGVAAKGIIDAARSLSETSGRFPAAVQSVPGAPTIANLLRLLTQGETVLPLAAATR